MSYRNQGLLDFARDFDVALMDKVVTVFYTGAGQEVGQGVWFRAIADTVVGCAAANGTTDTDSA